MSKLCYFLCYFNAALFFTCAVLGVYVMVRLFIADRLFWRAFFGVSLTAGILRYQALYSTLIEMTLHDGNQCFYGGSITGFSDTLLIISVIALFVYFVASGKCREGKKRRGTWKRQY